jgi:hypothetical protein
VPTDLLGTCPCAVHGAWLEVARESRVSVMGESHVAVRAYPIEAESRIVGAGYVRKSSWISVPMIGIESTTELLGAPDRT